MEGECQSVNYNYLAFQIIVLVILGAAALWMFLKYRKAVRFNKLRKEWSNAGKDVVVLHQFQSGKFCKNISPFALKLETFLRLANIKYKVETANTQGPHRGKCPWISFNGHELEDSQLIINYLTRYFDIKLDDHLDQKQKAHLYTLRILGDDHLFWINRTYRYVHDRCRTIISTQSFPKFTSWIFQISKPYSYRKIVNQHGMGLYTPEQIYQMCYKACEALSITLDDNEFFGGSKPCTTDCSLFGHLSQIMWNAPGSRYEALIKEEFPKLAQYCERMKNHVYPDWNVLLNPPK